MHLIAHAGTGWLMAESGRGNRRFRGFVLLAAVLPDIDAMSRLFGPLSYELYHHVLGHNLLFSLIVSAVAAFFCKSFRLRAFIFTQLAFLSHYFGDYFFTRYYLQYFYPFSHTEFLFPKALLLSHPINLFFMYLACLIVIALAYLNKRTPIEIFSPALDARIVNLLFRKKTLKCHICTRPANELCSTCGRPACIRHGSITRNFTIECTACKENDVN